MYKKISFLLLTVLICFNCSSDDVSAQNTDQNSLYFPPINSNEWETQSAQNLGWNTANLNNLYTFLEDRNTRAFIVLKNGKIVIEEYYGQNLLQNGAFTSQSIWYWASAGKTITSALVGIAQQNQLVDINDKTSDYLGENWTNLSLQQENQITLKHQLSMTTGLNDEVADIYCTQPHCLEYLAAAGTRWAYYNPPYTLLDKVLENASGQTFDQYSNTHLENRIGMNGVWNYVDDNNVYFSTARDMARFGLLILNQGIWETTPIITDHEYVTQMTQTSQNHNLSYGYLWWLNGKASFMMPTSQQVFNENLIPDAPNDMISAIGKNGQTIDIVPSQNLVVIRMGESPDGSAVSVLFQREMWALLQTVINN